ncbi:ATP-binding protein [Desulfosporosinus sp.]|uniref:ATP-binding protein n=1 Tax=Desulfosporosinus sp. TaxID=157907 RepID=UPI0025BE00C5|nr:ATP-binding protein [Desulfosporosinus sp.]MBC2728269.1 two-component sensor histidine kinase [Desulfosporosinus sp.]
MVNVVTEHSRIDNSLLEAKSHEIRTYMTRIISMTDLTLMTEVTEEQRDYLTTVKSSTKLLLKVLTDIIDYSKIQAGKVDLEQRPFDIRQIVHEVIDLFNTAAQQKNIEIRLKDFNNEIPKNVIGDSLRIKQVLSNLVGNSVRFTNQGGVAIEVDLEELNERWMEIRFIVSDTGIGIPEDKLSKLIKGFREADSLIKEFGGTGLIITKELVRLMDGELYVDSREGIGSKFYFTAVFGV